MVSPYHFEICAFVFFQIGITVAILYTTLIFVNTASYQARITANQSLLPSRPPVKSGCADFAIGNTVIML